MAITSLNSLSTNSGYSSDANTKRIDKVLATARDRPLPFGISGSKPMIRLVRRGPLWRQGADGTGSGVAFWLVHDAPLEKQPVVFIGSEGEGDVRPVAKDLPSFLSLLAAGLGPREAPDPRGDEMPEPLLGVQAILTKYFPDHIAQTPEEIVSEAWRDFGDVEARLMELSAVE